MKSILKPVAASLFCAALIVSCNSDDRSFENDPLSTKSGNLSLGQIHNAMLQDTYDTYTFPENLSSVEAALTDLTDFQKILLQNYPSSEYDMPAALGDLSTYKEFVQISHTDNILESGVNLNATQYSLEELNEYLYNEEVISLKDRDIVISAISYVRSNKIHQLSWEDMRSNFITLQASWDASQTLPSSERAGEYSRIILDISLSSLDYWTENTSLAGYQKIAPWLAADIVGAIAGAGISAGLQHFLGRDGEINWRIVAASGIATAVCASTGVFGRVGGWLSKF